jgi:adenosylcobinamide-phosphate synthase
MLTLSPFLLLPVLLIALVVDGFYGWPDFMTRRIGHPVIWIGALIERLDRALNDESLPQPRRRSNGMIALATLLAICGAIAVAIQTLVVILLPQWWAVLALGLLMAPFFAQKSLYDHVAAVQRGLREEGLEGGRREVAKIVGRDSEKLDEHAVGRAAVESLSENFSDGVIAPLFWAAIGGLPGIVLYKAINTADSMIGHRTQKHGAFGWASAKLDDLVNLPASRLSALIILIASLVKLPDMKPHRAVLALFRDARRHRSPNAGWPEAAMAGALGIRLGGPRVYDGETVDDAWMGDGREAVVADDIERALSLFVISCATTMALVALIFALLTGKLGI